MRVTFSAFEQYNVAEAHIDETQINGRGGAVAPMLSVPLRLDVSLAEVQPRDGVQFVSLQARLSVNGVPFASSQVEPVEFVLQKKFNQLKDRLFYLEFPLDSARIEAFERLRNGGDMKLHLDVVLVANKLHMLNEPSEDWRVTAVWGHVQVHRLQLQADLTIPRDSWISRVLPHVGYGVIHVLEFSPAPVEACALFDHAFKALQQAQELHRTGRYDDAVGKCRVALDKFFDYEVVDPSHPDSRRIPILKKSWAEKTGKALHDFLNETFGAIKQAGNRPHHSPNAHYDHFESQMIIAVTTTVVAYAARMTEPETKT